VFNLDRIFAGYIARFFRSLMKFRFAHSASRYMVRHCTVRSHSDREKTEMKQALLGLYVAALLVAPSLVGGCATTDHVVPLIPEMTEDSDKIWIYLQSSKGRRDGVYRCVDDGTPECIRATDSRKDVSN